MPGNPGQDQRGLTREGKAETFEPNNRGDDDETVGVNQMADGGDQVEQITRLK